LESLPVLGSDDGRPLAFDALPVFLCLVTLEKEVTVVFLTFIAWLTGDINPHVYVFGQSCFHWQFLMHEEPEWSGMPGSVCSGPYYPGPPFEVSIPWQPFVTTINSIVLALYPGLSAIYWVRLHCSLEHFFDSC